MQDELEELFDKSPIAAEDKSGVLDDVMKDEDLEDELKAAKENIRNIKARAAEAARRGVPFVASGPGSSSDGASGRRKPIALPSGKIDHAHIKQYLPPNCRLSKQQEWHHRW